MASCSQTSHSPCLCPSCVPPCLWWKRCSVPPSRGQSFHLCFGSHPLLPFQKPHTILSPWIAILNALSNKISCGGRQRHCPLQMPLLSALHLSCTITLPLNQIPPLAVHPACYSHPLPSLPCLSPLSEQTAQNCPNLLPLFSQFLLTSQPFPVPSEAVINASSICHPTS